MKKFKFTLVLAICLFTLGSFAQSVEGYKHHETDGDVSLYYKKHKWGVTFRGVNKRDVPVYLIIDNVKSTWTDGRTRRKDVYIGFIKSGGASNGGNLNTDNYAKIKGFSFDSWRWSTQPFDDE